MRSPSLAVAGLLLFCLHPLVSSNPDRSWQAGQVQQIQRVPNARNNGDHWEYVLVSNGLVYTLRTGGADAPYLNESLGSEIKIASTVSGSNHPFDGDEVYVIDAKGKEHKMDMVSAVIANAGCKQ
jgi:hypothetical protein